MDKIVDYAAGDDRPSWGVIAWIAHVSCWFPLFVVAAFYGEWFFGWYLLGHPPRPALDDPKDIAGLEWAGFPAAIAIMGVMPMGLAALVFNTLYVINHRLGERRILRRVVWLTVLWVGMVVWFYMDPGRVTEWWFD